MLLVAIAGAVGAFFGEYFKTRARNLATKADLESSPRRGKRRCRMHGGAPGSGAPSGRRNGNYRHGHFTAEAKEQRRRLGSLIRDARKTVRLLV
jgi:hypothetical protein